MAPDSKASWREGGIVAGSPESGRLGGLASTKGAYHLDVHRNPKDLVRRWPDPAVTGCETQVRYGIYEVHGDSLWLCLPFREETKPPRPRFGRTRTKTWCC
jgi:hypothetical protein